MRVRRAGVLLLLWGALAGGPALAQAGPEAQGQARTEAEDQAGESRSGQIQSGQVPVEGDVEVVPLPDPGEPRLNLNRTRPPGGSVIDAIVGRKLYHGNFCGHGNRGPELEPVDLLDAACKRHDECYDKAQYRSCYCDRLLKQDALKAADAPDLPAEVRARAGTVAQAAELMDCKRP